MRTGKTNEFPRGKLNDDDEGAVMLAIAAVPEKNAVIIDFGTPVKWIGLPKEEAIQFAKLILLRAQELK